MNDFVTRKQRLSKKDPSADFRLADNDDFFGFQTPEKGDLTATQLILALVIGLPVLWFTLVVFFSITPNI